MTDTARGDRKPEMNGLDDPERYREDAEIACRQEASVEGPGREPVAWRCFHCDEVFTDEKCACAHFGSDQGRNPGCVEKLKGGDLGLLRRVREVEEQLIPFLHETSAVENYVHGLKADHATSLRRAEEDGYAKGLRDGRDPTMVENAAPVPSETQELREAMMSPTIERLAKHLHDEEYQHNCTWPEHQNDEGYRGNGGWVRITPKDVQAECREKAKRIWRFLGLNNLVTPTLPGMREAGDAELSSDDLRLIDQAWENHKAALPVATVINNNQPGRTAIIEVTIDPPTLDVGARLYAEPKALTAPSPGEWQKRYESAEAHAIAIREREKAEGDKLRRRIDEEASGRVLVESALRDVAMIFASRPDIWALCGFAERPKIEAARNLVNSVLPATPSPAPGLVDAAEWHEAQAAYFGNSKFTSDRMRALMHLDDAKALRARATGGAKE